MKIDAKWAEHVQLVHKLVQPSLVQLVHKLVQRSRVGILFTTNAPDPPHWTLNSCFGAFRTI
jgi:hypothetical protein